MLTEKRSAKDIEQKFAEKRAKQIVRAALIQARGPGLLDRWLTTSSYVRAAIIFTICAFLWLMGLELAIDGNAYWGFIKDGHYFVAQKPGINPHEVSKWAWLASWAAHYLVASAMFSVLVANILNLYQQARDRESAVEIRIKR